MSTCTILSVVGVTTAGLIIKKMSIAIWLALYKKVFPKLEDENTWKEISNDFMINCNHPHCIGAIDGKHLRIMKPAHSRLMFHNYKNFFSIVLMAIADRRYKFIYIDVGSFGRELIRPYSIKQGLGRSWRRVQ